MHRSLRFVVLTLAVLCVTGLPGAASADGAGAVSPPDIVPFSDWAPTDCPAPTGADARPTQRVVVHHSHHPTAAIPDEVLPALAEMCDIHTERGFDTVGYHYVVDPWGRIYQGRGGLPDAEGRAPTTQPEGAHVAGGNPGATGVVFLGDHEAVPPTEAAVDAAVALFAWLVEATGVDPAAQVTVETTGGGTSLHAGAVSVQALDGHNATNATLCPGEHLLALLDPIRDRVRDRIVGAGGVLRTTASVRAAPDGEVHVLSVGPVTAAPPPDPGVRRLALADAGLLAGLAAVLLRRRRAARSG